MKKEMLVAVIIGFLLGLVITYGIYRIRIVGKHPKQVPITTTAPSATPSPEDSLLTIHNPEDGLVQKEKSLTVTGRTIPDSYVVLFLNDAELIRQSDADGNFSFDTTHVDGSNLLVLQVLDNDGKIIRKERTVIVTSLYEEPPSESASPSAKPTAKPTATPKATATPKPSATPKASTTP